MSFEELFDRVHEVILIIHNLKTLYDLNERLIGSWLLHQSLLAPLVLLFREFLTELIKVLQVWICLLFLSSDVRYFIGKKIIGLGSLIALFILRIKNQVLVNEHVLKEVIFITIDCEHFKDRDHANVSLAYHLVEKERIIVVETALESVLLDDLLLEFLDRFHLILVCTCTFQLTSTFIRVIIDLKNLIYIMMIIL